jgi:hypothetical protein
MNVRRFSCSACYFDQTFIFSTHLIASPLPPLQHKMRAMGTDPLTKTYEGARCLICEHVYTQYFALRWTLLSGCITSMYTIACWVQIKPGTGLDRPCGFQKFEVEVLRQSAH